MDITTGSINWQNFAISDQRPSDNPDGADNVILILSDDESPQEATDSSSKSKKLKRPRDKTPGNSKRSTSRSKKAALSTPQTSTSSDSIARPSIFDFILPTGSESTSPSVSQTCPQPTSQSSVQSKSINIQTLTLPSTVAASTIKNKGSQPTQSPQMQPSASFTLPGYVLHVFCKPSDRANQQKLPVNANVGERNVALVRPTNSSQVRIETPQPPPPPPPPPPTPPIAKITKAISGIQQPLLTTSVCTPQKDSSSRSPTSAVTATAGDPPKLPDGCAKCVIFSKALSPLLRRLKVVAARPKDFVNVLEVKRILAEMDNQVFTSLMLRLLKTFPEKLIAQISALEPK